MGSIRFVKRIDEETFTVQCGEGFWGHEAVVPLEIFSLSDREIAKLVRDDVTRYKVAQKDLARDEVMKQIAKHQAAIESLKSQL
jgi:hypothetical protein